MSERTVPGPPASYFSTITSYLSTAIPAISEFAAGVSQRVTDFATSLLPSQQLHTFNDTDNTLTPAPVHQSDDLEARQGVQTSSVLAAGEESTGNSNYGSITTSYLPRINDTLPGSSNIPSTKASAIGGAAFGVLVAALMRTDDGWPLATTIGMFSAAGYMARKGVNEPTRERRPLLLPGDQGRSADADIIQPGDDDESNPLLRDSASSPTSQEQTSPSGQTSLRSPSEASRSSIDASLTETMDATTPNPRHPLYSGTSTSPRLQDVGSSHNPDESACVPEYPPPPYSETSTVGTSHTPGGSARSPVYPPRPHSPTPTTVSLFQDPWSTHLPTQRGNTEQDQASNNAPSGELTRDRHLRQAAIYAACAFASDIRVYQIWTRGTPNASISERVITTAAAWGLNAMTAWQVDRALKSGRPNGSFVGSDTAEEISLQSRVCQPFGGIDCASNIGWDPTVMYARVYGDSQLQSSFSITLPVSSTPSKPSQMSTIPTVFQHTSNGETMTWKLIRGQVIRDVSGESSSASTHALGSETNEHWVNGKNREKAVMEIFSPSPMDDPKRTATASLMTFMDTGTGATCVNTITVYQSDDDRRWIEYESHSGAAPSTPIKEVILFPSASTFRIPESNVPEDYYAILYRERTTNLTTDNLIGSASRPTSGEQTSPDDPESTPLLGDSTSSPTSQEQTRPSGQTSPTAADWMSLVRSSQVPADALTPNEHMSRAAIYTVCTVGSWAMLYQTSEPGFSSVAPALNPERALSFAAFNFFTGMTVNEVWLTIDSYIQMRRQHRSLANFDIV
ncbi:hypothetical protein BCR39DRAFT_579785 [Naematelia encephala]|uniref:Uncharacterized protein n=1 Tax=Naematelia encephala TaxID=71784 RepID=A0A1Y2AT35_9TREE|nr:hypothetical protein BCR39DRAFT_579785 [Naematelia encephala]